MPALVQLVVRLQELPVLLWVVIEVSVAKLSGGMLNPPVGLVKTNT